MQPLSEWKEFYVIVGSAAAVLIGLQFVVLTLVPVRTVTRTPELGSALSTPTTVHFGTVLLLAALAAAPWKGVSMIAILFFVIGIAGIAYMIFVLRGFKAQGEYEPVFEDWLFHIVLPFAAYALLAVFSLTSFSEAHVGLFGIAASGLLLLFIGVHNAWDTIAYLVFIGESEHKEAADDMKETSE